MPTTDELKQQLARKPRKGDHVVMRGDGATCLHCGDHQTLNVPQLMESWAAVGKAFAKVHARCTKKTRRLNADTD